MKGLTVLTILTLALVVVCTPAQAQNRLVIYSVKFLCGLQTTVPSSPPAEPPVKPGNYATAINIHNFHPTATVEFRKKAVVANPEREPRGGRSAPSGSTSSALTRPWRWTAPTS